MARSGKFGPVSTLFIYFPRTPLFFIFFYKNRVMIFVQPFCENFWNKLFVLSSKTHLPSHPTSSYPSSHRYRQTLVLFKRYV